MIESSLVTSNKVELRIIEELFVFYFAEDFKDSIKETKRKVRISSKQKFRLIESNLKEKARKT